MTDKPAPVPTPGPEDTTDTTDWKAAYFALAEVCKTETGWLRERAEAPSGLLGAARMALDYLDRDCPDSARDTLVAVLNGIPIDDAEAAAFIEALTSSLVQTGEAWCSTHGRTFIEGQERCRAYEPKEADRG